VNEGSLSAATDGRLTMATARLGNLQRVRPRIDLAAVSVMLLVAGCARAPQPIVPYYTAVAQFHRACEQLETEEMQLSRASDGILLNCRIMSRDSPLYPRFCGDGAD
jgi:hypothetical protein